MENREEGSERSEAAKILEMEGATTTLINTDFKRALHIISNKQTKQHFRVSKVKESESEK